MLWFQTQEHELVIDLHIENDRIVFNDREFLFSDIQTKPEFRALSRIIFYSYSLDAVRVLNRFGVEYSKPHPVEHPVEVFSQTHISKQLPSELPVPFMYGHYLVSFIFYPESTGFKDALCLVTKPADASVPFNVTTKNNNGETIGYDPDRVFSGAMPKNEFLPKCTLTANTQPDKYNMTFRYKTVGNTASNASFVATVKTNKGYISHQKIDVSNGVGQFVFIPLGLSNGEIAKIQVGIGKFTDVASLEITC